MATAADVSPRAAVVAAGARWSAGQRALVQAIGALDASGEWMLDGSATCAHWVAAALDVEVSTAREWLRVGRRLEVLPVIDRGFASGRLSYSKVRSLTRLATTENEAELCELADRVPAGRLNYELASWLARHETPEQTEARQRDSGYLCFRTQPDGMIAGWFRLAPAEGAVFTSAVDGEVVLRGHARASADAFDGERTRWPSTGRQRADALVALVAGGGTGVVTEIVLHVRGDGCTLDDGTPIAETVVERIAPQSFLRALIHDSDRRPINASGRHRYPTDRQKRVVHERDRHCPCGATQFLQYHHDPPFEDTKRTVIEELWLKCRDCHRADHPRPPTRE